MENVNAAGQSVETAPNEILTSDMLPKEASEEVKPEVLQDDLAPKVQELTELVGQLSEAYKKKVDDYESVKKWNLKTEKRLKDAGLEDEEETPISEERIGQIIEEKLKAIVPEVLKPKDDLLEKANRINAELKIALNNRSGIKTTAAGSNLDKPEVNTGYWSPEQVRDLKRRGLDPEKVLNNLPKK